MQNATIFVAMSIVLALATLISLIVYQNSAVDRSRERTYRILRESAAEQAAVFNAKLDGQYDILRTFAGSLTSETEHDAENIMLRMRAVISTSDFIGISVCGADGYILAYDGSRADISDRWYFLENMAGRDAIERLDAGALSQEPRIVISVPIVTDGGVVGSLIGTFDDETIGSALISEAFGGSGHSFVCDSSGKVLISSEDWSAGAQAGEMLSSFFDTAEFDESSPGHILDDLAAGRADVASYTLGGVRSYAIYQQLGVNSWTIFNVVAGDAVDAEVSLMMRSGYILIGIVSLVFIAFLVVTVITGRRRIMFMREEAETARANDERYRTALEATSLSIWDYDYRTRSIIQSPRSIELHGYERIVPNVPESLIEDGYVHPDSVDELRRIYADLYAGAEWVEGVIRAKRPDGSGYWYEHIRYKNLFDSSGKPYLAIGLSEDVTEKREAKLNYERELRLQQALAADMCATALIDVSNWTMVKTQFKDPMESAIFSSSDAGDFFRLAALRVAEDGDVRAFLSSLTSEAVTAMFMNDRSVYSFEYLRDMADGRRRWVRDESHLLRDPDTGNLMLFLCLTDIDSEKRRLDKLSLAAETDSMTGLYDHNATMAHIGRYLELEGSGGTHALFMIDIDNFKSVNDNLGHQRGDEVIGRMADTMRRLFRTSDIIGRVGGDEFLVLMKNVSDIAAVREKASELINALQFVCTGENTTIALTGSVGVSIYRADGKSVSELYSEADAALYRAKNEGKNQFSLSDSVQMPTLGILESGELSDGGVTIHLNTLMENMDGGVILAEIRGEIKIVYASPSMFKTMSAPGREMNEHSLDLLSFVLPDERAALEEALYLTARTGRPLDTTYRVELPSGGGWHHLRAARMPDAGDGVPRIIGVVTDVSELKQMESQLRFAEERYRTAMEQTGVLLWEVDLATRTLYQSFLDTAGGENRRETFTGVPDSVIATGRIHPGSVDEFRRMYMDLYAGRDDGEYIIRAKMTSDEYTWIRSRFTLLRNENGAPYYSIGIAEPTPNIEDEMLRFERERGFAALIIDNIVGAIRSNLSKNLVEQISMRGDRRFDSGRVMTYDDMHMLCGKTFADAGALRDFRRDASAANLLEDYRAGKRCQTFSYRRVMASGEVHWCDNTINLIRHPISGDIYCFSYVRDMDASRQWELDCPHSIERDAVTFLYSRETAHAIIDSVLSRSREDGGLCAMTLIHLADFERLKAEKGSDVATNMLFTLSRVCRSFAEGSALVGRLGETHIVIFRTGIVSAEVHQARSSFSKNRIADAMSHAHPNAPVKISYGIAIEPMADATYDSLLSKALLACRTAAQLPESAIAVFSEPTDGAPADGGAPSEGAPSDVLLFFGSEMVHPAPLRAALGSELCVEIAEGRDDAIARLGRGPGVSLVMLDASEPGAPEPLQLIRDIRAASPQAGVPILVLIPEGNLELEAAALAQGAADAVRAPFSYEALALRVRNTLAGAGAADLHEQARSYELRFQQQANLLRLADTDEMTGLYGKRAFSRLVRARLDEDAGTQYMLLRLDIDSFKLFNDVAGVAAGDRLLRDIGGYLLDVTPPGILSAHLDSDHFVCFSPVEALSPESAVAKLNEWLAAYPADYPLAARAGVYIIDEPEVEVDVMCDRAMLALRSVKGSYADRLAYYDDTLRDKLLDEQRLVSDMGRALEGGQFVLYFQPQFNYASGDMTGVESLVRWNHPERGLLSPGSFVPLFEKNGFISALDDYVWEKSCQYMRKWLDGTGGTMDIPFSVNVSRRDLYNPHLCENLMAVAEKYSLPPSLLKLEITESSYIVNPDQLTATVKTLQSMGFSVEMDDFGSGFSSLNMLKDMPVDALKLDIRFLTSSEDDARGGNILSSIIRMARWLKLPVIAEGVETRRQADYLKSIGCLYMQGNYFSYALPAEEFEPLLYGSRKCPMDKYRDVNIEGIAAFWDASAQMALIFNSFVGGAAIFEYHNGLVEALRINDNYFRLLGTTREEYAQLQTHILDQFEDASRRAYIAMLESAIATGEETECETLCRPLSPGAKGLWTRTRARLLAKNNDSYIFYVSVENISERKELEYERTLGKYSSALYAVYDEIFELDLEAGTATTVASKARGIQPGGGRSDLSSPLDAWLDAQVHPGDRERMSAFLLPDSLRNACAGGVTPSIEYRLHTHGIRDIWCSGTILQMDDSRFLCCSMDITERKEAVQSAAARAAARVRRADDERNRIMMERTGVSSFDYDVSADTLHYQASALSASTSHVITDFLSYLSGGGSLPQESRDILAQVLNRALSGPVSGSQEYRADFGGTGLHWHRVHYVSVSDESGEVYRILGQIEDIQNEKDREALLNDLSARLGGQPAASLANETVSERVFRLLYSAQDTDGAISSVLESLGRSYDVSRICIFENTPDHRYCRCTLEWTADGVKPGKLPEYSYERELAPGYLDNFDADGVFYCPDLSALPEDQRRILEQRGIISTLQCAIIEDGEFCGYVGFDECRDGRLWTAEQIGTLSLVGKLIGSFLMKNRRAGSSAAAASITEALDNFCEFAYIIDPETFEIIYVNNAAAGYFGRPPKGLVCYRELLGAGEPCAGCPCTALYRHGRYVTAEIRRSDGAWMLARASHLRLKGRDMMLVTCTDITKYKT